MSLSASRNINTCRATTNHYLMLTITMNNRLTFKKITCLKKG